MNFTSKPDKKFRLVVLFVLVNLSTACTTAPQYYKSAEVGRKLGCFRWNVQGRELDSPPEYQRDFARAGVSDGKPGDFPNSADHHYYDKDAKRDYDRPPSSIDPADSLLYLSVARLNTVFAGGKGIYHGLFKDQYAPASAVTGFNCSEDEPYKGGLDEQVAVSAFSIPASTAAPEKASKEHAPAPDEKKADAQKASDKDKKSKVPAGNSGSSQDAGGDIDAALEFQTQIVISAYLYSLHPADRLDRIYTLITPLEPGVEFISIDKTEPKVQPVEYGDTTVSAGLTGSAVPFGMSYGQLLAATPSFSQGFTHKLKRQFANQNVEIFPLRNILLLSEDGGPAEADLSGNRFVTATIRIPAASRICAYRTVYEFSSKKLTNPREICHIDRIKALMGTVSVERKVVGGEETVAEDDDAVELIPFKNMIVFDLWKNPTELYGIAEGGKMVATEDRKPVLFRNYASALNFRSWIEGKTREAGSGQHCFDGGLEKKLICVEASPAGPALCLFRPAEPDYDINIPRRKASDYCPAQDH